MNQAATIIASSGAYSSVSSTSSAIGALIVGVVTVSPWLAYLVYLYGFDREWWGRR